MYCVFFNYFVDLLKGLEMLWYLGFSYDYEGKIVLVSLCYCKVMMKMLCVVFMLLFVLDFFMMLLIVFVVLFLGFGFIDGNMNLLIVFSVLIFVLEYFLLVCEVGLDYYVIFDG